ncbi:MULTISPECIES: putative lipid II flippase FtsW [unclassified Oceanispirochaeta]|uniref:putative lipid II flippase FtsW n=1 Tax=unclassified Oceanispirochaeta TaxID=2635722 RepID=UPI000E0988ED|nr:MULTISPECIES: putative lipid II flippase FtsW [unclassified Oceanispirochaeta]MBF9016137.1 putative lipid II flippase FtsW [Oceanispirochaeta sp. M2]NPD72599.1 putative lipid II flippase FtsW [Oceanispirochaeta sp. M1]RDG31751.1 putative lipid II flippase FtsW [Oceanispirochaeta sp. M1]
MRRFEADRMVNRMSDSGLLAIMVLLTGTGVSALFSASYHFGSVAAGNPFFFFNRQIIWIIIGTFFSLILSRVPLDLIRKLTIPFVIFTLVLNALTYVPGIGSTAGGAQRWIEIAGNSFQPSELVRVALVLYVAHILEKKKDCMDDFVNSILPVLIMSVLMACIVYFQNDFSSAIYVFLLAIIMLFLAGISWTYITIGSLTIVVLAVPMILAKPYRLERISSWLSPMADPSGAGYQLLKSKMALQNGSFLGRGLGQGQIKLGGLPAAHSDFVFAVVGEETGFVGVVFILLLFLVFALKGYSVALNSSSCYVRLAAFGLTSSVYFQVLINVAVVCGALPATGIPLPLFSAGGTSTLVTLGIFGLLINFSRFKAKDREVLCGA